MYDLKTIETTSIVLKCNDNNIYIINNLYMRSWAINVIFFWQIQI